MSKKNIIIFLTITLSIIFFLSFDLFREGLRSSLTDNFKIGIKRIFFGDKFLENISDLKESNYNLKKLPNSEFVNFEFKTLEVKGIEVDKKNKYNFANNLKKFYLDQYIDKIVLVSFNGDINLIGVKDLNELKPNFLKIKTNLDEFKILGIQDILILNNKIYLSYATQKSQDCKFLNIAEADINFNKKLNFKNIFITNVCTNPISAGRMLNITHNQIDGILISTNYNHVDDKRVIHAQDKESHFGKTLFFNLKTKKATIFTLGHKNPQGLVKFKDKIIMTEHGPKGGDELNLLKLGENYGWPVASYGEYYSFKYGQEDYSAKKNHKKNGFKEPIYSFVPGIGISQLISIPKSFHKFWSDENFLISSLNGRSLFRIRFNESFEKVMFIEKIFVGERIRDIIYNSSLNAFILAMEDTGSIGLFTPVKNDG